MKAVKFIETYQYLDYLILPSNKKDQTSYEFHLLKSKNLKM